MWQLLYANLKVASQQVENGYHGSTKEAETS